MMMHTVPQSLPEAVNPAAGEIKSTVNVRRHTMKTMIDPDLCTACGLCVDSCPDIYEMGVDVAEVIVGTVPADLETCALEAEKDCPVEAITHE